jgi:glycosyltransferase involved in cell wall biosynthesis
MKILLILTAAFEQGGTQNDMIQLARTMTPLGYRFHLAAPAGGLVPELEDAGVVFHEVPDPLAGPLGWTAYVARLARIVRRHRFEVLAPQSIRSAAAAGILRSLFISRAPVVASLHNLHNPASSGTAARILRRSCQMVTLENHYEKRLVGLTETRWGIPTEVVYSGVDLERFHLEPEPRPVTGLPEVEGRLVGCVARLSPEKDHVTLLRAWRRHLQRHPQDHLVLVGDGPERERVEKEIALLTIGPSVTLLGDRQDVAQILPHLDLFVLSSSRESYPRSAREALACGVPVILPAIGACGEIVSSAAAGSLFKSGDWVNLADRMEQILHGQADPGSRRVGARRHAEANFPLEKWRDTMDAIYRRMCPGERCATI